MHHMTRNSISHFIEMQPQLTTCDLVRVFNKRSEKASETAVFKQSTSDT